MEPIWNHRILAPGGQGNKEIGSRGSGTLYDE